jgi:DNA-binding NtrC family response regulator
MQPRKLLVVDDDPGARDWLAMFATRLGYDVEAVATGEEAVRAVREVPRDLVTLDVMLPGISGLETLKELQREAPLLPVVMLSGHGPTQTIVQAVRSGAVDFLRKPFEPEQLERAFARALNRAAPSNGVASVTDIPSPLRPGRVVPRVRGEGAKIRLVQDVIDHVADTDITVLIRGESGTGKELVAQEIYEKSTRRDKPFVKVNCAALPSELLESELFGYEKGAFTGAERRKLGKFEIANHGTIFLDEISEMHPNLQAKLLQVLQDGEFSRLGGQGDVVVDVRVLAATNRDLEALVSEGGFREDLFYRLNVVTLPLPALRERRDEIPLLTEHFLKRYAEEYGREYSAPSAALREALLEYAWPGNVRELENLVKRMVVMGGEEAVVVELRARTAAAVVEDKEPGSARSELDRFIKGEVDRVSLKRIGRDAALAAERRLIEKVLQRTRWNRKKAAEILQISYKALLYKMRDAGLVDRV